jgi:hypothetical protein
MNWTAEVRIRRGYINFSSPQGHEVYASDRAQTPVERTWDEHTKLSL